MHMIIHSIIFHFQIVGEVLKQLTEEKCKFFSYLTELLHCNWKASLLMWAKDQKLNDSDIDVIRDS